LGSGAFIGGLINGSGAIAASGSPEFNLQTEVRMKAQESSKGEWIELYPDTWNRR
jgi:hypothetical protein